MTTTNQITVFVCGPTLNGEALNRVVVRDGAVVWDEGSEPAPHPVEPIRAVQRLPIAGSLMLLVTDTAIYLASTDDLPDPVCSPARDAFKEQP